MDDRALLERAAKAAGIEWSHEDGRGYEGDEHGTWWWDPLHDEGARYRIARTLNMVLDFSDKTTHAVRYYLPGETMPRTLEWPAGDEKAEALSIVRAAAALAGDERERT